MSQPISYKDTLNLPANNFPMKANLAEREPQQLTAWEREGLYQALKAGFSGKPKFILHDGPPYANGNIHIGHALNKILKDIIVKFKTMQGFDALYVPGWDCHGLPIEHALFKELGLKDKAEVDQVKFRQKARKYAEKYIKIQKEEFIRLGIFADWDQPYLTMNPDYQATIARAFYRLYEKGFVYKGEKPIHWCFDCETALAEAELEYADKTSDSVYVEFPLLHDSLPEKLRQNISADDQVSVLIWTTTPWTLPANVAVALHPDLTYGLYEAGKGHFVLFCQQLESTIAKFYEERGEQLVLQQALTFTGKQLAGTAYHHPFINRKGPMVLANFVSHQEGTGCVHIAPGHGQEDYEVGREYHLDVLSPVDAKGRFTKDFEPGQGQNVLKVNALIMELLKQNNCLVKSIKITHSYPHCWRCKTPIIFRATKQWFLKVDHLQLRQRLLAAINTVRWTPEWGKNRISPMIQDRPDWCLSRQRLWGVAIPIFYCSQCGNATLTEEIASRIEEVFRKESADAWFYRPVNTFIPEGFACVACKNTSFEKETDILDVWFDSGVSHQSVLKKHPGLAFPAALYLEGSDQHRGWFQSSLIASVALEEKAPFLEVLTHGFTVDAQGKKMSKSSGNVVAPQEVTKKYGADILRLWVSSCDYSQDVRISTDILGQMADAYRKIRNTFKYFLGNLHDFRYESDAVNYEAMDPLDQWALGEATLLLNKVTEAYTAYRFHHIYRIVYDFCIKEMSSFYLDILKDRLYTAKKNGPKRRSSQTAMYLILKILTKVLAPILPFTCEEVWKTIALEEGVESVHLSSWEKPGEKIQTLASFLEPWRRLMRFREYVNLRIEREREKGTLGSSLEAHVKIYFFEPAFHEFLKQFQQRLEFLLIVSQVSFLTQATPADAEEGFGEVGNLLCSVEISHASGEKCERCWVWSEAIGQHEVHKTVCPKCVEALT